VTLAESQSDDRQRQLTRYLAEFGSGDRAAGERALALLYDELHALAAAQLARERKNHTLQATALVHEAWLRLVDQRELDWRNRSQFFALAAQAIRRVLVDHERARSAGKRGGRQERITLHEDAAITSAPTIDLLALDEALEKLALLDARQSRVVELRYFAGLSVEEVAQLLDVSARTVAGDWHMARAFLRRELEPPEEPR